METWLQMGNDAALFIQPLNKNDPLNYIEPTVANSREISERAKKILNSLEEIFPEGIFSLKVATISFDDWLIYRKGTIYDINWKVLGTYE